MKNKIKIIIAVLFLGLAFSPVFVSAATIAELQAQVIVLLQRVQELQTLLNAYRNGGQISTSTSSSLVSINSITPTSGPTGTQITIVGNGFTGTGNKIRFGNTFSNNDPTYSLNSNDGRTLSFSIPATSYYGCQDGTVVCYSPVTSVGPGTYAISIINNNGISNTMTFTVTSSSTVGIGAPMIFSVSPSSGPRMSAVTISGSGFTPFDTVQFSDLGTYVSPNYVNSGVLTFTLPIALSNCNVGGTSCTGSYSGAVTAGTYNVRVINQNGTSNAGTFTVTSI